MADEVVAEKDFPCPCGKGILKVEVLEHDVYASGRHSRSTLLCKDCKEKYCRPWFGNVLISKEHNEEIEKRQRALFERRKAVGDKAVARYLPQFKERVKSLKFKTAMHDAVGSESSIEKFREATKYGDGLDRAIEHGLRERPERSLGQFGVKD